MDQNYDLGALETALTELEYNQIKRQERAHQLQEMLLRIECFQSSEPQPGGRA